MVETPQKGETLKSSWAASVARAVNDSSPMGAAGFLARDGVTGRGFEALPQNRRERRAAAASTVPSPFTVRTSVVTQESTDVSEATKKLKVEMYSLYRMMARVNKVEGVWDSESEFGNKTGWVEVYAGDLSDVTLYAQLKLSSTVTTSAVTKTGAEAETLTCKITTKGISEEGWTYENGVATLTVAIPIAHVNSKGEVTAQYHEGVILFYAPIPHVKCGSDSNIRFALDTDGAVKMDVYYI